MPDHGQAAYQPARQQDAHQQRGTEQGRKPPEQWADPIERRVVGHQSDAEQHQQTAVALPQAPQQRNWNKIHHEQRLGLQACG